MGQQGRDGGSGATVSEPHMIFTYEDKQILEDAASLVIYHVKRQPTIHKDDKDHIKRIVQHFVPDLFFARRGELSETEEWTDEEAEAEEGGGGPAGAGGVGSGVPAVGGVAGAPQLNGESRRRRCVSPHNAEPSPPGSLALGGGEKLDLRDPEAEHQKELDDVYNLFFLNNNWYFFLRLHQTLCARLLRVYRQAERQLLERRAEQDRERLLQAEGRRDKASDLAMELRLKQPSKSPTGLKAPAREEPGFFTLRMVSVL